MFYRLLGHNLNVKQFYFKQFSLAKFHTLVLCDPYIGINQMLDDKDREQV